jgi:type I restriction enzyme S subunit
VIPKFIVYGLISKPYKDKLLTIGNSGGATRQAITKTQIEDFIFYYPQNKEEQNNLITKLDSVYLHAQNLGEIYKKQIRQYAQLKSAILKQELQSSEAA